MKQYKGMGRVFSFTLTQQVRQKGWRTTTLLLTLASRVYAGLIVHRGSRVKWREVFSMAKGGAAR